ncbi:MAG: hypothetical protein U0133_07685 [Gemmatimonadales bacterium]
MIKRFFGIDGFDVLIQVGITAMIMIVVDSASHGPESDGALAMVVACSMAILAWRRNRALKHRPLETTGEYQSERLAVLEDRVAELEHAGNRVLELEERLEFTERMLVQVREQADARLLPGDQGR